MFEHFIRFLPLLFGVALAPFLSVAEPAPANADESSCARFAPYFALANLRDACGHDISADLKYLNAASNGDQACSGTPHSSAIETLSKPDAIPSAKSTLNRLGDQRNTMCQLALGVDYLRDQDGALIQHIMPSLSLDLEHSLQSGEPLSVDELLEGFRIPN